jgi:hypothetical protein
MANCSLAQVRNRVVSPNRSWSAARPVFFDGRQAASLQCDLFGDIDELVSQLPEALVTIDPLADRLNLVGPDSLAKVLPLKPSLQDVVRPAADTFPTLLGLEVLLTEMAAANLINLPHVLEDLLTA